MRKWQGRWNTGSPGWRRRGLYSQYSAAAAAGRLYIWAGFLSSGGTYHGQGRCKLLKRYGYHGGTEGEALEVLRERVCRSENFPHEIGLFLGYPLEDVIGFIENAGKNSKCTGYWQVYGDELDAERRFKSYRKCSEVYRRLWNSGRSLQQLTVAA